MYLPMISGYELGQFLRILLWIFVPAVILSMLVTTWLHYRRKQKETDGVWLSIEGLGDGKEEVFVPVRLSGKADGPEREGPGEEEEYKETVYKGILWMKEKYEQYRDLSDQRYERLKEELIRAEKKLEEKQRVIADLEEQGQVYRQKIEELVEKLRNNSQLLLNIYQELDKSLRTADAAAQP